MDKRLRQILIFFSVILLLLSFNLTYLQVFKAKELTDSQYNTRALKEERSIKRGSIISADGIEVAQSEQTEDGSYQRFYPAGEVFSNITGFYDLRYGRAGLENKFNDQLLGKDSADDINDYIDRIRGRNQPGNDLILSIDSKIQRVAYQNMIGKKGAIVALDPKTGAVLSMVSYPGFNPNNLKKDWTKLIKDSRSPLVNRASNGLYPPGSSFKIVTLAAALTSNKTSPTKVYPAPATLNIGGNTISNYKQKGYGKLSLNAAFANSVNTVFAQIGNDVGGDNLLKQAELFGFNKELDFDLSSKKSSTQMVNEMDDVDVAWTAVGQGNTLATPLQMVMVTSAIANNGKIMKPFIVSKVRNYDGKIVEKNEGEEFQNVISLKNSKLIKNMMIEVVKNGTGRAAQIESVLVAGKSGTAEVEGNKPHAWFVSFAPADNPRIAIAVLVENSGTGGAIAAPIAREVMKAALKR